MSNCIRLELLYKKKMVLYFYVGSLIPLGFLPIGVAGSSVITGKILCGIRGDSEEIKAQKKYFLRCVTFFLTN